MPIPDTTIRDGRERPTPRDPPAPSRASSRGSPLARARLAPRPRPPRPSSAPARAVGVPARAQNRTQVTSHHQHHAPCVAGQLERHETPDPVRSNAVKSRIHCVRPSFSRDPRSGPNSGRDPWPAQLRLRCYAGVTSVSANDPGSVAGR